MDEFFGISMNYIAGGAIAATVAILGFIALIAIRNPVMFKMGLRNIPRRKAQTTLIVVGLMLSTVIITAAFGTGDTMNRSITAEIYTTAGEVDQLIVYNSDDFPAPEDQQVIPLSFLDQLRAEFAGDEHIEAFMPLSSEVLPVQNTRSRLNEAEARIVAWRAADAIPFGGLQDIDGNDVAPQGNEIVVNEKLAEEIDARVGDRLLLFYGLSPVEVVVSAIAPNTLLAGTFNTTSRQGGAVSFEFLSGITGQAEAADFILVTNRGGVRDGVRHSEDATAKIEALIGDRPYTVEEIKREGLEEAALLASFFTTFFVVFGLFSIAAGVLLIFLIFVMLAAERKPEMGMARAVGAKRRQIVESFLAEGVGYDLGAAIVGLVFGIAVVFAMVALITWSAGDSLGLILQVHVTPRSLVTSFCFGVIATFIVIFIASWRASRINITAAIRDLPESHPVNPEGGTWLGYLRGVLNGFVAVGITIISLVLALRFTGLFPLFLLAAVTGIVGPWIYVLRGSNVGAPRAERLVGEGAPRWPWILGLALLPLGGLGLVVWAGYGLGLLVVRLTRDRKPSRIATWVVFAGILLAPLGVVLAALQDRGRAIAWSVGLGTVGAVLGAIMVQWGLEANSQFLFAGGVSLVALWIAVTLRYFHIAERLSFTAVSVALLAFWYITPSGRLDWLFGELEGDFEMFFLSGLVMVTAGTFIVVYNADVLLPAVARLGNRFGRIVPAVKTAVAYPLVSRFRTGMTIMMIGLIMFSLIMFQTINSNFARVFLSDDAKGGWDVQVVINSNNRIGEEGSASNGEELRRVLREAGADTGAIETIAEVRVSRFFETQVGRRLPGGSVFGNAIVNGGDETFFSRAGLEVDRKAAGYETSADVWRAVASDPSLAMVTPAMFGFEGFGDFPDIVDLGDRPEDGFEPFTITLRDPSTGAATDLTVVGVTRDIADTFFMGIWVSRDSLQQALPAAGGQTFYLTVAPGADAGDVADMVEATLVQASADSLDSLLDEQRRVSQGFLLLFQGFMGLGLLVGIAALGVIASRAVVERRQQIGMLRAIGYQRSMVALSFLFESSFIALSGIVLGFVLAVSLSWVLFTSGNIDESAQDAGFIVPWLALGVICAIAFAASLLMTFIPARQASRVPVAEALRYE
jgi:ABC-type antimicrobial peptide transport system permease subunit